MVQYNKLNDGMEGKDHFKNWVNFKNWMSRANFLLIASFTLLAVFFSCEKNDNNDFIIKGDNIEGSENAIRVIAQLKVGRPDVIFEAPFENGGFELRIPHKLSVDLLVPVTNKTTQGVSISSTSASWAFLDFIVEFKNMFQSPFLHNNSHLHLQDYVIATKEVAYVYVDRSVKLSGMAIWIEENVQLGMSFYDVEYSNKYNNLTLVSGWNKVCLETSVDLSDNLLKVYNVYSTEDTNDCKWNILFVPY